MQVELRDPDHCAVNLGMLPVSPSTSGKAFTISPPQGLAAANTLEEVIALHRQFVSELDQQCGRGGAWMAGGTTGEAPSQQSAAGGTHKHMWAAITRVLDQAVRFCSAHRGAAEAAVALCETSLLGVEVRRTC